MPRWAIAVVLAMVVLIGLGLGSRALVSKASAQQPLDPDSSLPYGTSALRELLSDENIDLTRTTRLAATLRTVGRSPESTTVVVVNAGRLSASQFARLLAARPAQLVLLAPASSDLAVAVPGARSSTLQQPTTLQPGCTDHAATRAGAIELAAGERLYNTERAGTTCYAVAALAAVIRTHVAGVSVVLLPQVVQNQVIAHAGNAALAMNVLGQQPRLVWLMASVEPERSDSGAGTVPDGQSLLPAWWPMLLVQVLVALVAVGLWRGRRFGPIITERLPVRIRASETVEGHGRLYQQRQARATAAAALRRGTLARLRARLGAADDPQAIALLIASHTGRPLPEVARILTGPAPVTDDDLRDLAIALDELEQEARHS